MICGNVAYMSLLMSAAIRAVSLVGLRGKSRKPRPSSVSATVSLSKSGTERPVAAVVLCSH